MRPDAAFATTRLRHQRIAVVIAQLGHGTTGLLTKRLLPKTHRPSHLRWRSLRRATRTRRGYDTFAFLVSHRASPRTSSANHDGNHLRTRRATTVIAAM
jgi:hypothetical protein